MADFPAIDLDDQWILGRRTARNHVDPEKPYAILKEEEVSLSGKVVEIGTLFLTDTTCPFHCLMCDLWKNTTDLSVSAGMIPRQIAYGLEGLNYPQHLKLYNSGNFFDQKAVPMADYDLIAGQLSHMQTVIVENHPRLVNERVLQFRDRLSGRFEIAMGLETVHPEVLRALNKRMDLEDFASATSFLKKNDISVRAFILLRPPFLDEEEGIEWACRSLEFAFAHGVDICSIIPTRSGNGAMEWLQENGYFNPPAIPSLEKVLEFGLSLKKGIVMADLWDLINFSTCDHCLDARFKRLNEMNLSQQVIPRVHCHCNP